ncbi:MAG: TolC family protein [Epsilonproteobacteria bacterium]|nr:TolC family protein [Campylobacterota bacterium]
MISKRLLTILLLPFLSFNQASADGERLENLTLTQALELVKSRNQEIKVSKFNEQIKAFEARAAKGNRYGNMDVTFQAMNSNDAGNVFGFKMQSREATFGDFGFNEFDMSGRTNPLPVAPKDLNYPSARNHFQTKLSYSVPFYTGGKLDQYEKITEAMKTMSSLDTTKLLNEKVFQTKKTYYDIALVDQYIKNLSLIIKNIKKLQNVVVQMRKEGYAIGNDKVEVDAKLVEVESMLNQAKLNKELAYQYISFLVNADVRSLQSSKDIVASIPVVNQEKLHEDNIDIQKASLGLKITDMAIKIQETNFSPMIGGFAEYASADDTAFNNFFDHEAYTVGVQMKWNIFDGGISKANLEKAKIENLKMQEQVELAKSGISLQTTKILTEIKSKDEDIKNLEKQLELAKKVYENYHARYKEGLVSISDLLIKQSKEIEVLMKLLTAKNEHNSKVFELESIINKGEII